MFFFISLIIPSLSGGKEPEIRRPFYKLEYMTSIFGSKAFVLVLVICCKEEIKRRQGNTSAFLLMGMTTNGIFFYFQLCHAGQNSVIHVHQLQRKLQI